MARRPSVLTRAPSSSRPSRGTTWTVWLAVVLVAAGAGWFWYQAGMAQRGGANAGGEQDSTEPQREPRADADPGRTTAPVGGGLSADGGGSMTGHAATNRFDRGPGTGSGTGGTGSPPALPSTGPVAAGASVRGPEPRAGVPVEKWVGIQVALARQGMSSGSIDGVAGAQTRAALREFQRKEGLPQTGEPDGPTIGRLGVDDLPFAAYTITAEDLAGLTSVPKTWLGKSALTHLGYESIVELVAERNHASPRLVRLLNPDLDWRRVVVGQVVRVPAAVTPAIKARPAFIRISLSDKALRVFDASTNLLVLLPCSIAAKVEKRPVGLLHVARLAPHPNYRFDPVIFPESEEARRLGRKLMIPPGPNNPVGTAWIGLDRPGYGIHGTPHPEEVGRTESHGCFRLANWNAELLLRLVWVGMPVYVER